jgi:hypothetical protein
MPASHLRRRLYALVCGLASLAACGLALFVHPAQAAIPPCLQPGWFPGDFGLKDHTIFWYDGYYYLASIYLPGEAQLAYGRSTDLCNWETLPPLLAERPPDGWDEFAIWAPHVFVEAGVYYMYYTGVTYDYTQSILLATTTNPADPASWQPQGVVFQPNHPGMRWQPGQWADCRTGRLQGWRTTLSLLHRLR